MSSKTKVISVIIILVLGFLVYLVIRVNSQSNEIANYKLLLDTSNNKVKYLTTSLNNQAAELSQTQSSKKILQQVFSKQLDSVSKILNIKKKDITGVTTITTSTSQDIKTSVTTSKDTSHLPGLKPDTTKKIYSFNYNDDFLNLSGILKSPFDTVAIKYHNTDKLSLVQRNIKDKIIIDAFSLNPHTSVTGMTSFNVSLPKVKHWGVGVAGGVTIDKNFKPALGATIGITYNFLSF